MANTTTQFTIKINGTQELVTLDKLINQNAQSVGELKDQQDALNQAYMQKDMQNKVLNSAAILLLVIRIELKYH
jgi:hypothetical protein